MSKKISILIAFTLLAGLTACKSESYSTSTTDVQLTTTEDGQTTQTNMTSEVSVGLAKDVADESDVQEIESEGGKYDTEEYDLNYQVIDSGNLVVYGPETSDNWWRMLAFDDSTDTMEFVADETDENSVYYVEIASKIQDGNAQVILGHFTAESEEDAVDYAIIDVEVEDGKVVAITDSGFTDDLSNILD